MDLSRLEGTALQRHLRSSDLLATSDDPKRRECTAPAIGKQIYMEVFNAGFEHRQVKLSTEQEEHLSVRSYCSPAFLFGSLRKAA
jgi:hypothetical protein